VNLLIESCCMVLVNHLFAKFLNQFSVIAFDSSLYGGGCCGCTLAEKGLYIEVKAKGTVVTE